MKKIHQKLENEIAMIRMDGGKAALGIWKED
jgi:hypothetical protein